MTLVASPRPPSPTSRTHRSAGVCANRWKATAVITSNTVIAAPAFTCSTCSNAVGQRFVGNQVAGDADAFVEAHQMWRGIDMHAQARRPRRSPAGRRRCCPCRWCRRHGSPAATAAPAGPSAASSRCSRSRLRSISRGCRPCSRATMPSIRCWSLGRVRQRVGGRRRRRFLERNSQDQPRQHGPQFGALYHHVDDAVLDAGIRRSGSLPAGSRGRSARSPARRQSRSARLARRSGCRPAWRSWR